MQDIKVKYLVVTQNMDGTAHMQKFSTGKGVNALFEEKIKLLDNVTLGRVSIYKRGTKYWSNITGASKGCGGDPELIRIHRGLQALFPDRLTLAELTCQKFAHVTTGITDIN